MVSSDSTTIVSQLPMMKINKRLMKMLQTVLSLAFPPFSSVAKSPANIMSIFASFFRHGKLRKLRILRKRTCLSRVTINTFCELWNKKYASDVQNWSSNLQKSSVKGQLSLVKVIHHFDTEARKMLVLLNLGLFIRLHLSHFLIDRSTFQF